MKKSFLALAVAALAATSIASTASATTVYDKDGTSLSVFGRVQTVFYSDKTKNVSGEESTIKASARLGVDLRTQINSGIAAFARAEWDGADSDGKDTFEARYLWVGLDFGQAGSLKVGRFEPAIKYAISQTDIFDDWGCAALLGNDDKREGVVQYQWSGYGFDAIASYIFAKDGEHIDGAYQTGETVNMKNTVSLAVGYTSPDVVFGPIAVRAGYEHGNVNDAVPSVFNTNLSYDDYDALAVGVSWGSLDLGPYVGAVYQQREFSTTTTAANTATPDYKTSGYEFAVGYSFANGVTARTGYMSKTVEVDGGDDADAAVVPVYANWQINPQFNVWAEARFDAGTDDSLTGPNFAAATKGAESYNENVYSAGMRYVF
ncbi:porin [Anaerobiospirillum sp. NML120448]|uniref:porin n=1 Tax=Anaerobiospirillum sp. NML120448 TaxID=2932816 RepID=UPI001FF68D08|nr:porin [Anaerobiospirillum sp. NML120448]MCK0515503.1 porin [Anaerobiospirillum sp. NML120448]